MFNIFCFRLPNTYCGGVIKVEIRKECEGCNHSPVCKDNLKQNLSESCPYYESNRLENGVVPKIMEVVEEVSKMRPYKEVGNPDSYSSYNEGWQGACDTIQGKMEKNNEPRNITKHPIQPLVRDEHGVVRFKANKIVQYLLRHCNDGMNTLARQGFSLEDQEQFAQLIGYSHSVARDLPYMNSTTLDVSYKLYQAKEEGFDQKDILINYLESRWKRLRKKLADDLVELFEVHPDDLKGK